RNADREREPEKHAIHREAGVLQHGAVEEQCPQRAGDLRQRWQQRRRKDAAARNRLIAGGRQQQRDACPVCRGRALHRGFHGGGPLNSARGAMVGRPTRWKRSFSRASPIAPMTATPASITSVFKNSRAPKIIQPSPHGTAASISTPTRMRQACAKPSRNPVS